MLWRWRGEARARVRGQVGVVFQQGRSGLVEVLLDVIDRSGTLEGLPAGEQLEEQDAQGVDVGLGADRFGTDLLRGDVGRRADDAGQHGIAGLLGVAQVLGDAEVSQVGVLVFVEQDVGRFQVAVDDAHAVGGVQRAADLVEQAQDEVQGQGTVFEAGSAG